MSDILVFGNCAVDLIAATIDSLPTPGSTVTFDEAALRPGGCAVNVAMALGRLGVACDLATRVGEDRLGSFLLDELEDVGVACGRVIVDSKAATPFTFVMLDSTRQRSFFHHRGTNDRIRRNDLSEQDLAHCRFLVVAGAMGMASLDGAPLAEIFAAARACGVTTVLDTLDVPVARERWLELLGPTLEHTSVFAPSLPEARKLTGLEDPIAITHRLLELGASNVALKLSERGAIVANEHTRATLVPTTPLATVVDTTGAGDCFVAGLVAGLARGDSLSAAARLGNAVARACLTRVGASDGVPPLEELAP